MQPAAGEVAPGTTPQPDPRLSPIDVVVLYGTFQRRLEQMVAAGVRAPAAVVEDACQAAWMGLIRYREQIDGPSAPGWLVRTAVHEALRLLQEEDREDSLEGALEERVGEPFRHTGPGPEDQVWERQRVHSLRRLSVRQQRLVWLRALGLSYEEMASYEQCTCRTVRRQMERARRNLRLLDGPGSPGPPSWASPDPGARQSSAAA